MQKNFFFCNLALKTVNLMHKEVTNQIFCVFGDFLRYDKLKKLT